MGHYEYTPLGPRYVGTLHAEKNARLQNPLTPRDASSYPTTAATDSGENPVAPATAGAGPSEAGPTTIADGSTEQHRLLPRRSPQPKSTASSMANECMGDWGTSDPRARERNATMDRWEREDQVTTVTWDNDGNRIQVEHQAEVLPPLTETQEAIVDECDRMSNLLLAKNRAYGNSATDPIRIFSRADASEQLRVRIDDKLSRIKRGVGDEEDTVTDLTGYLILYNVMKRLAKGEM